MHTLDYLVPLYESPFAFFEQLSQYWIAQNCHYQSQSKLGLCDILWQFAQQNTALDGRKFQWLMKFDLALHEKPRKIPVWLTASNDAQWHHAIFEFYRQAERVEQYLPHYVGVDSKVIARQTHLEVFGDEKPVAVLFDYAHKDLLSNAAYMAIPLEDLMEPSKNEKA